MEEIRIKNSLFRKYISENEIQQHIQKVADAIIDEYKNIEQKPTFIITLTGAIFFACELLKRLPFSAEIGVIKCASYNSGMTSSGEIKLKYPISVDVKGKDIIVIEDIIDTGCTWEYMHQMLLDMGAKNIRIATMCLKKESYKKKLPINWAAIAIDNSFVVGMGMDYDEYGRNYPCIYIHDKDV